MKDPRCGCCEGIEPLTPLATANRPGLDALRYRVGTHSTFYETMVARLTGHRLADGRRPLHDLTTRDPEDPALAMLDAWATVADVLTFYQERIANEGYLLTATERRSVLELANLVGYRLRPGVAASVWLAFSLDNDFDVTVPAGTAARSLPGPDELPQLFETSEDLEAKHRWNALSPRRSAPTYLSMQPQFDGSRRLFLRGNANVSANGTVVAVSGSFAQPYSVREVAYDAELDHTRVAYAPYGAAFAEAASASFTKTAGTSTEAIVVTPIEEIATAAPLTRLADVVRALRKDPSLPPASRFQLARSLARSYGASADLGPQLLARFTPRLADTLYTAYANAPVTGVRPDELPQVEAMRVKAAPFGHNAPKEPVFEKNVLEGYREWALAELAATLEVGLATTDADSSIQQAFSRLVDPSAGDFPPLVVAIGVGEATGSERLGPVALSELTPQVAGKAIFFKTFEMRGVSVTLSAAYGTGPASGLSLASVGVAFQSGSQTRQVTITAGATINGGDPVQVETTGLKGKRGIPPGQEKLIELADAAGRPTGEVLLALSEGGTALAVQRDENGFATAGSSRLLTLDANYDEVVPGSWIVVDRRDRDLPITARVETVETISRADYAISGQVTRVALDRPWLFAGDATLAVVRQTTVWAQSEKEELVEEPITDDVAGDEIELDGLYDALEAGRWLVVKGERTDVLDATGVVVAGVEASELVMLAGVEHDVRKIGPEDNRFELPGDTLHTRLVLSEPLAYTYKRDTVTINANVAKATHGETQTEALGGGDAARAFQTFALGQGPLTYVAAATPDGVETTLEVRVNDVRWPERDTLLYLDGDERGYVTKTDDDGVTSVIFGDGRRGARLPTGDENVTAVYRKGIGRDGNVAAEKISNLATRPLGVKEVVNPLRASGGADAEGRDQARRNVPLATQALDRLVSVEDYAHFTRTFAGIAKAEVAKLSDGRREVVHLTIAGDGDAPIDPSSDLYRNLQLALSRFGDPSVPLQVATREAVFLFVSAKVKVHEDYLWDKVAPQVQEALLEGLGFELRDLGQDVHRGEVIGIIQAVEGVAWVDLDLLDGVSETDAEDAAALAEKLEALAAAAQAPPPKKKAGGAGERFVVEPARVDPAIADPSRRIRPAQIAYLDPALPDTLVLTEVAS